MRVLVAISRIFVGALFIFSGLIKLNDPIGFSFKLEEYFGTTVFDLPVFVPYALVIAIFVVVFEILLGVFLLIGYKPKFTVWSLLGMIVFFTFLTFYSAYYNKVTDCGCFGDAIKLTPWESFTKDIILLVFIIILFVGVKHIKPIMSKLGLTIVSLASFIFCFSIVYHVLQHLPIKDFRPYKIGANIYENMIIPEDAPKAVMEATWVFNVKGEEKVIVNSGNYPDVPGGEYVSFETKEVSPGYEPPIHDFSMERDGEDYTLELLNEDKLLIFISYNLKKAEKDGLVDLQRIKKEANSKGYRVIGLTANGEADQQQFSQANNLDFNFYTCDETALKTIVRSNPAALKLHKGTIIQKLHWNDVDELVLEDIASDKPELNLTLKKKLDSVYQLDQGIRFVYFAQTKEEKDSIAKSYGIPVQEKFFDYFRLWNEIDSTNLIFGERVLKEYGYPLKSFVGEPANRTMWFIIQHAPHEKIAQYIGLMKEMGVAGELPFTDIALMEDRYLMGEGEEQIYGSQGFSVNEQNIIWPIKDAETINQRRKEAGFELTIEEYSKLLYGDEFVYKPLTLEEVNQLKNN